MPLAVIYVAQVLQMSVPPQEPPLSPLLMIAFAVGVMACCDVPMALDCELENRLPIAWAMVFVC